MRDAPAPLMTLEIQLPCSDCDAQLAEQLVHVSELPLSPPGLGNVRVAVCPDCDAHHFPKETLEKLANASSEASSNGDR